MHVDLFVDDVEFVFFERDGRLDTERVLRNHLLPIRQKGGSVFVRGEVKVDSVIVLEALLERVGFEILEATYDDDFYAAYTCRWQG